VVVAERITRQVRAEPHAALGTPVMAGVFTGGAGYGDLLRDSRCAVSPGDSVNVLGQVDETRSQLRLRPVIELGNEARICVEAADDPALALIAQNMVLVPVLGFFSAIGHLAPHAAWRAVLGVTDAFEGDVTPETSGETAGDPDFNAVDVLGCWFRSFELVIRGHGCAP
jgi:hypothetical protein